MLVYINFAILAASTLFWLYFLSISPIISAFRNAQERRLLLRTGKRIQGEVIKHTLIKKVHSDQQVVDILVKFKNIAGTPITEHFRFTDTQPSLRRYEVGKSVALALSQVKHSNLYVAMAREQITTNTNFITFFMLLFTGFVYLLYRFIFLPVWEKASNDWHTFFLLFDEAGRGVGLGVLGFAIPLGVIYTLYKLFLGSDDLSLYKFFGKSALATITSYTSTGMRINGNPVIKFTVTFTTATGQNIEASDRKIVDKLALGHIHEIAEMPILYLPQQPKHIIFSEKIDQRLVSKTKKSLRFLLIYLCFMGYLSIMIIMANQLM
ncbi:MAG: hypothetical protein AAF734_05705 [Bacteroidota bacterium]